MEKMLVNRNSMRAEILAKLMEYTPVTDPQETTSVSFNAPVEDANAEVDELKMNGYLVVQTYGDDWDCGQVLRYALNPSTQNEVIDQHITQVMRCEWGTAIRAGVEFTIVEDGITYQPENYHWEKYAYGLK